MAGYHVQVRYRHAAAWVSIDMADDRRKAAKTAADAFRYLRDAHGAMPMQVRVIAEPDLAREGRRDAINVAGVDLGGDGAPRG